MNDSTDKRTHAQRRLAEAKTANLVKLRAGVYVRELKRIARTCDTAEPAQVPALRLKADIYGKLLAKCLPDLKSVEHTGEITHTYDSIVAGLLNATTQAGDAERPTQTVQ